MKEIGPSWEAPEDFDCSRRLRRRDLGAEADSIFEKAMHWDSVSSKDISVSS